jgi:ubiquinone/menaquinone biosynthesis C-methylase UbiE
MPSIEENMREWHREYHWCQGGDEWSRPWGSVQMQWHASILPRIHAFVPTGNILEIAPGHGRWTVYLKDLCDELIAVDASPSCIEVCKTRFADCSGISFHVNDGKSLAMVPEGKIDFAFSYDSLVHAEEDVMEAYVEQLAAKLKPNGVAFLHHSNLGQYRQYFRVMRNIPVLRRLLAKGRWRASSMTADKLQEFAQQVGLQPIGQELINWRSNLLIDCFSTLTPQGSVWARQNQRLKNPRFMKEARLISRWSDLYGNHRAA